MNINPTGKVGLDGTKYPDYLFFHYLSYQFMMRIKLSYTKVKLKQGNLNNVRISKEEESIL